MSINIYNFNQLYYLFLSKKGILLILYIYIYIITLFIK